MCLIILTIFKLHFLQFHDNLIKIRPLLRLPIPTLPDQPRKKRRRVFRYFRSEVIEHHHVGNHETFNILIGGSPSRDLPQNNSVRVDVHLLRINCGVDHFRSHPLKGADRFGHFLVFNASPAEIADFALELIELLLDENVEALQIAVDDGRVEFVQIVHSPGNVQRDLPTLVSAQFHLQIVQQVPQRLVLAVLQHNRDLREIEARSQKGHNVGVSHVLHGLTLVQEVNHRLLVQLIIF